jgi:hypothetical protein
MDMVVVFMMKDMNIGGELVKVVGIFSYLWKERVEIAN